MNIADTIRQTAVLQTDRLVNYLALRRDGLGISRDLLAQRLEIGEAELRAWEHGSRQPDLSQAIAWMVALGLNAVLAPTALEKAARLRPIANSGNWVAELEAELAQDFAPSGSSAAYSVTRDAATILALFASADDR